MLAPRRAPVSWSSLTVTTWKEDAGTSSRADEALTTG
jgi:hypothetical protein